ncbi:MAG: prepilin-type N-terminal cleavage/methylation domain-containing protein [Deltaproteobacteria bacterium]|nr:prepilin-type N-terminal cleavage/methylation domain-containing protein [Deltaproteobacteria bacterium]
MTTLETGTKNCKGFTLIEVLLSVVILAVGLIPIIGGYHTALEAYKRAQFTAEGFWILHQKMAEGRLGMRFDSGISASQSGKEGHWEWTTKIKKALPKDLYELEVEVEKKGSGRKLTAATYVRK